MSNNSTDKRQTEPSGRLHALLRTVEGRAQKLRQHLEDRDARSRNPDGYDGSVDRCSAPTRVARAARPVVESHSKNLAHLEEESTDLVPPKEAEPSLVLWAELAGAVTVATIAMFIWLFIPFSELPDETGAAPQSATHDFQTVAPSPLCELLHHIGDRTVVCDGGER